MHIDEKRQGSDQDTGDVDSETNRGKNISWQNKKSAHNQIPRTQCAIILTLSGKALADVNNTTICNLLVHTFSAKYNFVIVFYK